MYSAILLLVTSLLCAFSNAQPWMLGDEQAVQCYTTNNTAIPTPFGVILRWDVTLPGTASSDTLLNGTLFVDILPTFWTDTDNIALLGSKRSFYQDVCAAGSLNATKCTASTAASTCCVWHSNIHSCRRRLGACEPWVQPKNETNSSVVLVTHTPSQVGGLGTYTFPFKLPADSWVIIAHVKLLTFHCAVGAQRSISEPVPVIEDNTDVGMIVGVVLACVAVVVGIPVYWKLTENKRRMAKLLDNNKVATELAEAVALMDFDEVAYLDSIESPTRIQTAFIKIVGALKTMKAFMPATLFANELEDEAETDAGGCRSDGAGSDRRLVSPRVPESPNSRKPHSHHDDRSSVASKRSMKSNAAGGGKGGSLNVQVSVAKKAVSVTYIQLRHFHAGTKAMEANDLIAAHGKFIDDVEIVSKKCRGVPDTFQGDRVVITFNTITQNAQHKVMAARCGLELSGITMIESVRAHAGLSSAVVKCGNIGGTTCKRYTVVGECVGLAFMLSRLCPTYHATVLCTKEFGKEVEQSFRLRLCLAQLICPKYTNSTNKPLTVVEVVSEKKASEDEWMYQLQECSKSDPFETLNSVVALVHEGRYDTANATISQAMAQLENLPDLKEEIQMVSQYIKEQRKPTTADVNLDVVF